MREEIVEAVREALEPQPWALALWVGGSDSFGRADEWSDLDLGVGVEDGTVEAGFATVEAALESLAGIEDQWVVNPSTDVKPQRYYRVRGAPPWLLVDVGVFPASTRPADRFLGRRRHGVPRVVFDRAEFTADEPLDEAEWRSRLRRRVAEIRARHDFLGVLALKSARRGEVAEAVVFYQAFVLRPLVEALRIRHDPWRHDFDVRYLRFDLPDDVRLRLEPFWLVADLDDLRRKHADASAWLRKELLSLDVGALPL